jgi:ABC-type Zn uptake system ZnuABC Zn-binding protein ZnuA
LIAAGIMLGAGFASVARADGPLKVCATTPDLGSIAREVGGDKVEVTVFVKGPEDPHFLEAKPGFIKAASEADLLIEIGLELEVGWIPAIQANARNEKILVGGAGFLDASTAITPLEVPTGAIDRSMGDVHAAGNPHYLSDPINGIKVARLIADKMESLRPEDRAGFESRYTAFRQKVCEKLVGEALAKKYETEKLATLYERGKLAQFLESQHDDKVGGWLGMVGAAYGTKAVSDHNLWPYFAKRYGIQVIGFLEPKPGVSPTTKHLGEIVELMKRENVKLILCTPYFDARHAAFVSGQTGAKTVALAHQVGSEPGTDDYISMCDYNVKQLAGALKGGKQ